MASSQARSEWRERRTKIIMDYAKKYDLHVVPLNDGYQLRIDNIIDIYPTNGRYHVIFTGERGDWHLSTGDLRKIIEKARKDSGIVVSTRTNTFVVPDVSDPKFDFGGDDEPVKIQPYRDDDNTGIKGKLYGKPIRLHEDTIELRIGDKPVQQSNPFIPESDTYRLHKIKFPEEYPTEKRKWWQFWRKK